MSDPIGSPSDRSLDISGSTTAKKVTLDNSDDDEDDDQFYTEFATQQPTAPNQQEDTKEIGRAAAGAAGNDHNSDADDDSLNDGVHHDEDVGNSDVAQKKLMKKKRSKRGPGKISKKSKTMNGGIPRPRGRAKLGHKWDGVRGMWVPDDSDKDYHAAASSPPKVYRKSSKASTKIPKAATNSHHVQPTSPRTASSPYSRMRYTPPREETLEPVSPEAKLAREKIVTLARMDLWSDNEEVLANGLKQLTTTCEPSTQDGEFCRRACFETGVHMLVIKLLERFPQSATLQTNGLELLFRMSISSHDVIDEALLAMGAIEVASTAIFNHADESEVLTYACALLGNLTRVDGGWDAVLNKAILALPKSDHAEKEADRSEETKNLLSAIQDLQERHSDSESCQEASIFFIDVCLEVGKVTMLDLLVEHAPRSMSSLVRASKTHGPNNSNIRRTVRSVFKGVAELTGKN